MTDISLHKPCRQARPFGRALLALLVLVPSFLLGCETSRAQPAAKPQPAAAVSSVKTYTKPSAEELKRKLTAEQYRVTQQSGTEPPFRNAYWDNHKPGIYVDITTGEPLFSSTDKFDSGTGWPSFTKPLVPKNVAETKGVGSALFGTEVHSRLAGSHLGHVFSDGPAPTGLRYCINSASLRFVPVAQLEAQGLGEYKTLFGK